MRFLKSKLGHSTWPYFGGYPNWSYKMNHTRKQAVWRCCSHYFYRLNRWKKDHNLKLSIFLELWSNLFIFLGTVSIYGHVFGLELENHGPKFHVCEHFLQCFKVFNPSTAWKQRSTIQHFYIFGKIGYFLDTNEKQTKIMDPEQVQTFPIKHRTKNMNWRCIFCVLWVQHDTFNGEK